MWQVRFQFDKAVYITDFRECEEDAWTFFHALLESGQTVSLELMRDGVVQDSSYAK